LSDLSKIDLIIASNEALYEVEDTLIVNSLRVENGSLNLSNKYIETKHFFVGGSEKPYGLNIQGSTVKISQTLQIDTLGLEVFLANRSKIIFENPSQGAFSMAAPGLIFNEVEVKGGNLNLGEQVAIRKLSIAQDLSLRLLGDVLFDSLVLGNQTKILFESNVELATSYLVGLGNQLTNVQFLGKEGAEGRLNLLLPFKLCINAANVEHVLAIGEGSANAGADGILVGNTAGWFNTSCDEVLFAEFSILEPCVDGLTLFVNNSTGDIDSFTWVVTDSLGNEVLRFEEENPSFSFNTTGSFDVELIITDGSLTRRNFGLLTIIENPLSSLTIFKDRDDLVANLANINYQWFKNGELIPEATGRFLTPIGPGEYQVLGNNGQCSFLSESIIVDEVVGIEDDFARFGIAAYPNPMEEVLQVSLFSDYLGPVRVSLHDLRGASLLYDEFQKQENLVERSIQTSTLLRGIYILRIEANGQKVSRRMIKN
jgi:hypothetical protein